MLIDWNVNGAGGDNISLRRRHQQTVGHRSVATEVTPGMWAGRLLGPSGTDPHGPLVSRTGISTPLGLPCPEGTIQEGSPQCLLLRHAPVLLELPLSGSADRGGAVVGAALSTLSTDNGPTRITALVVEAGLLSVKEQ